jgi:hypothetical protein
LQYDRFRCGIDRSWNATRRLAPNAIQFQFRLE